MNNTLEQRFCKLFWKQFELRQKNLFLKSFKFFVVGSYRHPMHVFKTHFLILLVYLDTLIDEN